MTSTSQTQQPWGVSRPGLAVTYHEDRVRRALHATRRTLRTGSGPWRALPDYLIIGAQKAGTSSLWDHLAQHPRVARSEIKEIDYFNWFYDRSLRWYRGFFPPRREDRLTGEASPDYLYDVRVPGRVRADLAGVKLVVMLRDPIDRAVSHYHHERALGIEPLGLVEALGAEEDRLRGERERVARDPRYRSMALRHFSYVDRGRYADQLERWFERFPTDQMLILPSERFFVSPQETYDRVLAFLGLEPFALPRYEPRNTRSYTSIEPALRAQLATRFAGDNDRLFALVGERFDWTA